MASPTTVEWLQSLPSFNSGMELLPTELVGIVLGHVDASSRASCRLVCSEWRDVVQGNVCELVVTPPASFLVPTSTSVHLPFNATAFFSATPRLSALTVRRSCGGAPPSTRATAPQQQQPQIPDSLFDALACAAPPLLRTLNLEDVELSTAQYVSVCRLESLETLHVNARRVDKQSLPRVAALKQLRKLVMTPEAYSLPSEVLQGLPHLQLLVLQGYAPSSKPYNTRIFLHRSVMLAALSDRPLRYVILTCSSDDKGDIHIQVEKVGLASESAAQFLASVPADQCRFLLYVCDGAGSASTSGSVAPSAAPSSPQTQKKSNRLLFYLWTPESAPMVHKATYASSKELLKKFLPTKTALFTELHCQRHHDLAKTASANASVAAAAPVVQG